MFAIRDEAKNHRFRSRRRASLARHFGMWHRQHLRHDPPMTTRPWVLSEEGRASRIGFELDCKRCDEESASEISNA